jgi:hypothetical protein
VEFRSFTTGFVKLAFGARGFETYIDEGDFTFIEAREL